MKSHLVKLLKAVLVLALMAWVFSRIHFEDRIVERDASGAVVHEEPGAILGPWKNEPVRFQPKAPGTPVRDVSSVALPGGGDRSVQPGFLTYWRYLDPWLFAGGAFCYLLTLLIAGTRWWWLLKVNGMAVTLGQALRLTWVGTFFNNVMLGATGGDLIKAIYLMKRCPGQRIPALVSVIVDRVLGLASLAILAAIVVLFALDRFGWLAAGIWGVMLGVALLGVVAFSKRLRQLVRLKPLLDRLPHRIGHLLKLVDQAVFFYRGHKRVIAWSLLAGIGNHVISVLSVVLIGDALGVGLPWMEYFVLIPVINILSALPIGPNGWGLGETLYQTLFARYGAAVAAPQVMGTRGVALSVLYRLHLTLWSLVGGLFVLFDKDRVTRADIDHEVELEEHDDDPPAGTANPARSASAGPAAD